MVLLPSAAILEEGWAKKFVTLEPSVEVVRDAFESAKLSSGLTWEIVVEQVNALMTPAERDQHELKKALAAQFATGTYKLKSRQHKVKLAFMDKWAQSRNQSQDAWETITKKVEVAEVEGGEVGEASSSQLKGDATTNSLPAV